MIRINQLKLPVEHAPEDLNKKAAKLLHIRPEEIRELSVRRRSLDARKKPELFYSYVVDVRAEHEARILKRSSGPQIRAETEQIYRFPQPGETQLPHRPVIVGTGPAGLFCGLLLARHGYRPLLLERGEDADTRRARVDRFWETGALDARSNVQFGEGGAGTFSDGKLNTLVKDPAMRGHLVLKTFCRFGASESILYDYRPHIGTDVLCGIVKRMRGEIIRLGGEVRFSCQVTDIRIREERVVSVITEQGEELPCEALVLATGHSARDTFAMLRRHGVLMEAKAFAVGLRVQHPQEMINLSQYGRAEAGNLGAASYKVTHRASSGRGVYSFCMCPGGYVVNASSEQGRLAVNGMSYHDRAGENANSAVIITVGPEDFGGNAGDPLAGVAFQRKLEEAAFAAGGGKIPLQLYGDFCAGRASTAFGHVKPQVCGGWAFANLRTVLPEELSAAFMEGMEGFGRQIAGFDRPDALLAGIESRTSSPVRILRGEKLQSVVGGLYPCGEGAGYAGGITSAAMDGVRAAEAIAAQYRPFAG